MRMGRLLGVTLACGLVLAGCGKGGDAGSAGAKAGDNGASGGTATPVTLKILVPNNMEEFPAGSDVNNNEIAAGIRQRTGFNAQWELQPKDSAAAQQKLNVTMASGDTPDIIIIGDKTQFGSFVQQGLLTPLDDYLNTVAKDVKATLTPEQWKSAAGQDGKIYAVRTVTFNVATNGLLVRQDMLDQLGIKAPKTQDEFYNALKTMKEKKPDVVPYTGNLAQGLSSLDVIASMFYPPVDYIQKNGQVIYTQVQPEAKQFLTFANKLYGEGLIDKEAVVNKLDNVKEKLTNGKAAMTTIGWPEAKTIGDALKTKDPAARIGYIDPPTGANGSNGMSRATSLTRYFVIPKYSKHAKEAMEFLNKAASPDVVNFISFGEEGKHYEKKNGEIVPTKEAENIRYRVYYNMFDTIELGTMRMKQKGFEPYFNPLLQTSKYDNIVNLTPPVSAVDQKSKELSDLRDEYFLKIISGALPLSAFDEYVAKWKQAGGEDVVKALDAAYNKK